MCKTEPVRKAVLKHDSLPGMWHSLYAAQITFWTQSYRWLLWRSISFLRQKARTQKARKLGLSGLLASFPYMNFTLLKSQNYDIIQFQTVAFHRGKKPDLCTLLHKGVGENGLRFAEEWQPKPFMHTRTTCRNPKITRQTRLACDWSAETAVLFYIHVAIMYPNPKERCTGLYIRQ